jgi:hypothetical protein
MMKTDDGTYLCAVVLANELRGKTHDNVYRGHNFAISDNPM